MSRCGSTVTVHLWNGANIVADIDGNDIVVYVRGVNLIYADDGDKTYYHFNAHGDVVALTNESGNKTKSYSYSAFGIEYTPSDFDDNPFRYCGEYFDKETGTIYLRARYYNAEQGRFTQEDPIKDGDNWYSYCGGNPVMFVDPTGLSKELSEKTRIIMQKLNEYLSYDPLSSSESWVPPSTNFPVEQQNDISGGLVIAAGISMAADGPLLVGDVVSVVLLGIAAAIATMTVSPAVTTAPPISLPVIEINNYIDYNVKSDVITDEKVAVKEKIETTIDFNYWEASLVNKKIIIGQPLNVESAALRVSQGGSIMCRNNAAAWHIIYLNRYVNAVGPEIHGDGFFHYHPTRNHTGYESIHIWYLLP